jgi:hypothetical protein
VLGRIKDAIRDGSYDEFGPPLDAAVDEVLAAMEVEKASRGEEQEPERWDGLS